MGTFKFSDLPVSVIRAGAERRITHTAHLMLVIFDFNDGPQTQPDPPHQHPHEQASYVVEGEILFFLGGEPPVHLVPGEAGTGQAILAEEVKPRRILAGLRPRVTQSLLRRFCWPVSLRRRAPACYQGGFCRVHGNKEVDAGV